MNYILVAEDEADIRDIYEMILRRSFPLDVVLVESGNKAIETIKLMGKPEIIISDLRMPDGDGYSLYQAVRENKWDIPFVICSTDAASVLKKKFPDIYGFIEKPRIIDPLIEIVDSVISRQKHPPIYVPIRISLLLRWGTTNYDLFMKLSEAKYIKVLNEGEAFIPSDAERFYGKSLEHLYISAADADAYLNGFEKNISMVMNTQTPNPESLAHVSLESLESIERIASSLGWTAPVLNAAKNAVNLAIKAVSLEPSILKLLKQKLKTQTSKYSSHVTQLSLLTCGVCYQLGWVSESTQMKLGMASLLHDITIDENLYADITLWNQAASDPLDKSPEVVRYRNHPGDAANLVQSMKSLPPDVDQIILQHHEMKDGLGFPRGLITSRIIPMACVFIIVEDLINYIDESLEVDERVQQFLKDRENRYNSGNFKKVFVAFKDIVEKSKLALA